MKLKTLITALISSMLLGGCATAPKQIEIALHNSFDADARETAQKLLQKGNNTIEGNALIRLRDGGVVTCAGYTVSLVPVTAYASERMRHIYGSTTRGFRDLTLNPNIEFLPDTPEYRQFAKEVTCDAQGDFVFRNISDGAFYVVTRITWEVPVSRNVSSWYGGYLMQRVTVRGGETKEIVLAP